MHNSITDRSMTPLLTASPEVRDVLTEILRQGARQVTLRSGSQSRGRPPSFIAMRAQLTGRGTENDFARTLAC